jgi:uroporphyrinogen decarboxylase
MGIRDTMTSEERLAALQKGSTVDRVPFLSFILGFCARNVGYPVASIYSDPERSLQAQLWTREQYGYDSDPFFGYASYGGCEFGGEINLPDGQYQQAPWHGRFAVETEGDIERLHLPDVRTAGMLPVTMRFSQLQVERGITPSLVVGGPFTVAGNICVVQTLCRWSIRKPELVHRLLRLVTDHLVDVVGLWVDTFGAGRVNIQVWEPLASNQIISPRQFEQLVLPYHIEFHEKILAKGIGHILCHICGEQNLNLPFWAEVPMGDHGIVSIGKEVDIEAAIDRFGDRCVIAGNIEPAILQTGTPREIYELCRVAIEKGKRAPNGYALMQGCEVPVNAPPYNLYVMRKAIEDFGQY